MASSNQQSSPSPSPSPLSSSTPLVSPSKRNTLPGNTPTPHPWRAHVDPTTGKTYFYNIRTSETTWNKPADYVVGADDDDDLDENWSKIWDKGSNRFYYAHKTSHETSWTKPRRSVPPAPTSSSTTSGEPPSTTRLFDRVLDKETNKYYYLNKETNHVQWDVPDEWKENATISNNSSGDGSLPPPPPHSPHSYSKSWAPSVDHVSSMTYSFNSTPPPPPPIPPSSSNSSTNTTPATSRTASPLSAARSVRGPPPLPTSSSSSSSSSFPNLAPMHSPTSSPSGSAAPSPSPSPSLAGRSNSARGSGSGKLPPPLPPGIARSSLLTNPTSTTTVVEEPEIDEATTRSTRSNSNSKNNNTNSNHNNEEEINPSDLPEAPKPPSTPLSTTRNSLTASPSLSSTAAGGGSTGAPIIDLVITPTTPQLDIPNTPSSALSSSPSSSSMSESSTPASSNSTTPIVPSSTKSTGSRSNKKNYPTLPPPLARDIEKFQLAGFAESHFRIFKKRTGLVSSRRVSNNELLCWQKTLLEKSLLTASKKYDALAVKCFEIIMQFMTDMPTKKQPGLVAKELISIGVQKEPMRDEIFCQVCKQTNKNPSVASTILGWKLMALCCCNLIPTKSFQEYLMTYFIHNFNSPIPQVYILAPWCYYRVNKCIRGEYDHTITLQYIDEISIKGVPSYSVVFGSSLEYLCNLQKAEGNKNTTTPQILHLLCDALRANHNLETRGLFRIAGQKDHIMEAKNEIEQGKYENIKNWDVHVIADLLKIWLRNLSEPVIPKFMQHLCLNVSDKVDACMAKVLELPKVHFDTLSYLMDFLVELSNLQEINKMNEENIAIVFSPNLLRNDETDAATIALNSNKEKNFVKNVLMEWKAGRKPTPPKHRTRLSVTL